MSKFVLNCLSVFSYLTIYLCVYILLKKHLMKMSKSFCDIWKLIRSFICHLLYLLFHGNLNPFRDIWEFFVSKFRCCHENLFLIFSFCTIIGSWKCNYIFLSYPRFAILPLTCYCNLDTVVLNQARANYCPGAICCPLNFLIWPDFNKWWLI